MSNFKEFKESSIIQLNAKVLNALDIIKEEITENLYNESYIDEYTVYNFNLKSNGKPFDNLPKPKRLTPEDAKKSVGKRLTSFLNRPAPKTPQNEEYIIESTLSDAAHELVLYSENDQDLYRQSEIPIINSLKRKVKSGKYDHEKAKKLWKYHADRAAQSYSKKCGDNTPWHKLFSSSDRNQAASYFADKAKNEHLDESYQLDELKKSTLRNYIDKSSQEVSDASFAKGFGRGHNIAVGTPQKPDNHFDNLIKRKDRIVNNRLRGIRNASGNLETGYYTKEGVEELDELKKSTLRNYIDKSSQEVSDASFAKGFGRGHNIAVGTPQKPDNHFDNLIKRKDRIVNNRLRGIRNASGNLETGYYTKEGVEELDELKKSTLQSAIKKADTEVQSNYKKAESTTGDDSHKYFRKAINRGNLATAAEKKIEKGDYQKEDIEILDELKASTLGDYAKKAINDLDNTSYSWGYEKGKGDLDNPLNKLRKKYLKNNAVKRSVGIRTTIDKLVKGDYQKEDVESLDELKNTTLGSYISKSKWRLADSAVKFHDQKNRGSEEGMNRAMDTFKKRNKGIDDATQKLVKGDYQKDKPKYL